MAFALQDTLGNVIGGLAIQLKRPYAIGDWVSLDGAPERHGVVLEINWRATRVLTNEQVLVIVPNSTVAKSTILNFSQPSAIVRRGIRVSVGYEMPPSRVEEVALRAMRGSPGVLSDPPRECILSAFGDSGIEYWCTVLRRRLPSAGRPRRRRRRTALLRLPPRRNHHPLPDPHGPPARAHWRAREACP